MLSNYTKDYIEDIFQQFALLTVEADMVTLLEEDYQDQVSNFMGAFMMETNLPPTTFHSALLQIAADDEMRYKLARSNRVLDTFEELLDYPAQDDFYGTEGWEHFLGLD